MPHTKRPCRTPMRLRLVRPAAERYACRDHSMAGDSGAVRSRPRSCWDAEARPAGGPFGVLPFIVQRRWRVRINRPKSRKLWAALSLTGLILAVGHADAQQD